ncbi:MAG: NPXTG-anchored protein [Oscillospiraceae bacterium]|nr:NPXTG-anchored protein [Oscillospiraceae bacterium]
MKIRKIFAGAAAAALAVSAMSAAAFAQPELKVDIAFPYAGEISADLSTYDLENGNFAGISEIHSSEGNITDVIEEDDFVIGMFIPDEVDYSDWVIGVVGYDAEGNGGKGIFAEAGEMYVVASIVDIAEANGFTFEELDVIAFSLTGPGDEDVYLFAVCIDDEETLEAYMEEVLAAITESTEGADEGTADKGSPATGAEGVAVVAAAAIAAAGVVVVAKRRK